MRQNSKPAISRRRSKGVKKNEIIIIPFFTDHVSRNGDLFRFVSPMPMTIHSVCVKIDRMEGGPYFLNGGIQSKYKKISISQPVKLGVNSFKFDHFVDIGDTLILDFEKEAMAYLGNTLTSVSGITISIVADR